MWNALIVCKEQGGVGGWLECKWFGGVKNQRTKKTCLGFCVSRIERPRHCDDFRRRLATYDKYVLVRWSIQLQSETSPLMRFILLFHSFRFARCRHGLRVEHREALHTRKWPDWRVRNEFPQHEGPRWMLRQGVVKFGSRLANLQKKQNKFIYTYIHT